MDYTVKAGDTLNSIAAMTIGGQAYAPAIANYNGIQSMASMPAGSVISIPDEWLLPQFQSVSVGSSVPVGGNVPAANPAPMPVSAQGQTILGMSPKTLMIAGLAILAGLIMLGGKRAR